MRQLLQQLEVLEVYILVCTCICFSTTIIGKYLLNVEWSAALPGFETNMFHAEHVTLETRYQVHQRGGG